ncbi:homeodomain-like, Helicase/SANT-associated domain, Myb-like domain protein [Artemisia annua]|uniref:Homeodomain-like, Helicase/SANT-associated domain, Myb-like domain protein n=1 Tax=Artemisia annua TaxID=35608 RepID=A0A2U1MED8_ARTAN|nr:homeodomain-like, Helicase/SANT-associated domain, Myb-like domain protein [Artemisia annua]
MYTSRKKIQKDKDVEPSEFEESVAQLTNTQNGPSMPSVQNFVRGEMLPSGYLIRPCEGGGSIIHIVDHMNLEGFIGIALVVNAELDSMGGVGISSTPSPQQSSDLEKTQVELRQTFSAAEKFRRELAFLQSGGDPLDLKPANAASISFQSTSPIERHPEQFVTSEAKGSSAESSSSSAGRKRREDSSRNVAGNISYVCSQPPYDN